MWKSVSCYWPEMSQLWMSGPASCNKLWSKFTDKSLFEAVFIFNFRGGTRNSQGWFWEGNTFVEGMARIDRGYSIFRLWDMVLVDRWSSWKNTSNHFYTDWIEYYRHLWQESFQITRKYQICGNDWMSWLWSRQYNCSFTFFSPCVCLLSVHIVRVPFSFNYYVDDIQE